ncbi:hypothetical protein [Microbacterium stercoris]|uniref:ACT domain-containing protein n=1 Tax=Microbacterium stercoris TaxID=2820289 RepID=A0A939QKV5_9MICO|nr:hypothetical protein [Microbacterium stercoris]MBO3664777.1 hypothetical protein [Microbacterium stercoris]
MRIAGVRGAADLARIGGVLGRAGVGLEGGGMWGSITHYLVEDGRAAHAALTDAGWDEVEVREAAVVPLDADVPGALGRMMTRLADAGVELVAQYSDHHNRKVLVGDADAIRAALG